MGFSLGPADFNVDPKYIPICNLYGVVLWL